MNAKGLLMPTGWPVFVVFLYLLTVSVVLEGASNDDDDDDELAQGMSFLEAYGYMRRPTTRTSMTRDEIRQSVMRMQRFYNIPTTGELDAITMSMMKRPRCGVSDISVAEAEVEGVDADANGYDLMDSRRKKRYVLSGAQWNKNDLTFSLNNYTPDLPVSEVRRAIQDALRVWSDVTPLTFREVSFGAEADINILFAVGEHNDEYAFDGQGGTLAHAFYPGYGLGGDAHFDDDEWFTARSHEGTNLFFVAAHELGHSLGLGHSEEPGSLMAPYYQGYRPNFVLPEDDLLGIQEMYGPNLNPVIPTRRPWMTGGPTRAPLSKHCVVNFDALADLRSELFLFQGAEMYRVNKDGKYIPGYPVRIDSFFLQAPSNIDAAYERPDGTVVFLKGAHYWEYDGVNLKPGFPRPLNQMGLPNNINAALSRPNEGLTYFFRGGEYWIVNEYMRTVDPDSPRNIQEDFQGVPGRIDAAFSYWGKAYFYKRNRYWRYNYAQEQVENGPRNFRTDWLQCGRNMRMESTDTMAMTQLSQNRASSITTHSITLICGLVITTLVQFLFSNRLS